MKYSEINFDGLIGPTHNYAGLSFGNIASQKHFDKVSHPKQAALQGLDKMRTLLRLGYRQGFFLPQERPRLDILRNLGFSGSGSAIIDKVNRKSPELLSLVYSASSMWAANAATVTPSPDSQDQRVHFTPANLLTTAHRTIEQSETMRCLNTIFANKKYFEVHSPLITQNEFADEGAANHTRLCEDYGKEGIGIFAYGRESQQNTRQFPARQTLKASQAIARMQGTKNAVFLLQNPAAIDAGAFHNDVVAVGNGPALFFHQDAFDIQQQEDIFQNIRKSINLKLIAVPRERISLKAAISSYLFNSQLLAAPDGNVSSMRLICPTECCDTPEVEQYLQELVQTENQPIREVTYVDVRQSMSNGGGPACLRLRIVLNDEEAAAVNPIFMLSEEKIDKLKIWVNENYRDELTLSDLADPDFLQECYRTLDNLTEFLGLESYYTFQQ